MITLDTTLSQVHSSCKEGNNFLCRFDNLSKSYTIEQLGELNEINPEFLLLILLHFEDYTSSKKIDVSKFRMLDIFKYLEVTHLHYRTTRFQKIERLILNLYKVAYSNTELLQLITYYTDFKNHFNEHMKEEENELFPIIEKIAIQELSHIPLFHKSINFQTLKQLCHHHESETTHPFFEFRFPLSYYNKDITPHIMELEKKIAELKLELKIHQWVEEEILIKKGEQIIKRYAQKEDNTNVFSS